MNNKEQIEHFFHDSIYTENLICDLKFYTTFLQGVKFYSLKVIIKPQMPAIMSSIWNYFWGVGWASFRYIEKGSNQIMELIWFTNKLGNSTLIYFHLIKRE